MTDPKQIPFLVQLLDDDSWDVQKDVMQELAAFGPNLRKELRRVNFSLTSQQKQSIQQLLNAQKHIWIQKVWFGWMNEDERGSHIPVIDDGEYGPAVLKFFEERGISWTAWCFDVDWTPNLILDWDYTPSKSGEVFRDAMQGKLEN